MPEDVIDYTIFFRPQTERKKGLNMKRYTKEHEWVELNGDVATVGITAHAADELGDITYVELPAVGKVVAAGAAMSVVESVKAASDVFAPVGGKVVEVNGAMESDPSVVNSSAEGTGWFCKLSGVNKAEVEALMTAEQYADYTKK